ncbi:MAG TPA: hypothetical protein VJ865_08145 [Gemmatimonadaceae bacterium]|nr:hypothetical protein [Gemmatimonadaceae bacterium]
MSSTRLGGRFAEAPGWIAFVVIVVIAVALLIWRSAHPAFVSHDAALCKASYAKARTLQDTLIVDEQQSIEKSSNALSCGALRKSGEIH